MSEQKRFPWRTLCLASLGVNLLLVGGGIGAYGAGARLQRPAAAPEATLVDRLPGQRAFMASLPPEARTRLREEMVAAVVQSRELRQGASQARREALDSVIEEPYDAAQVKASFARMRAADQAVLGAFHDRVADTFATLTPEERQAAIAALRAAAPARRNAEAPAGEAAQPQGDIEQRRNSIEERRRIWRERRERRRRLGGG